MHVLMQAKAVDYSCFKPSHAHRRSSLHCVGAGPHIPFGGVDISRESASDTKSADSNLRLVVERTPSVFTIVSL